MRRGQKAGLGPFVAVPCATCAEPVAVSAKPLFVVVAGGAGTLGLILADRPERACLTLVLGVVAGFVVNDLLAVRRR
jgi:hypothetical protein